MNTIRRPRRRPRLDSVNFRTFYWLVRMEAAFQVTRMYWWLVHQVGVDRHLVPMDRPHLYVNRARKLYELNPHIRRIT